MADTHAVAGPQSHGGQEPAHGGGHASVRTYIWVALILGFITAIEVATLYVPGLPNGLLVSSLLVMSAIKFVLVVMSWRGSLSDEPAFPVEMVGLYWHFVDIVWIVIFTLVYLIPSPQK